VSGRRTRATALAALLLCTAASADAAASVDVRGAPFSVTVDRGRPDALRTAGPPVVRLDGGGTAELSRATSVRRSGRRIVAELEAPDAPGVGARLVAALRGGGITALAVEARGPGVVATGLSFEARAGERHLGFGERSDAVVRTAGEVESYVSDGPWAPADRALAGSLVPPVGFRARDDATYFPMPWLLSSRGRGVLALGDEAHRHRLGPDRWSVEADGPRLDLRLIAGPRPADALRRLTALIGRQPAVADQAVLGPWLQAAGDEADALRRVAQARAPLSLLQTYTHYLPCGDDRGRTAAERERTARAHAAGVSITTYVNPMVCTGYTQAYGAAAAAGGLGRAPGGREPYRYRYVGSTRFEVSQYDFTARAGERAFAAVAGRAVRDGHDGWMEDFGEYTPLDLVSADGTPGRRMHNRYPLLYHRAGRRAAGARAPVRFVRSGWTGSARHSPVVWGGDPTVDWGFDGLRSAVRQGLSMGLSGVGLWGSDVGGFFALSGQKLDRELLARWIELGAVSGVMRTQANGLGQPRAERPQPLDEETLPVWRAMATLRTRLWPYLAAARRTYAATGLPLMRHAALTHPADAALVARDDQYLLGPELLAAPVLEPGARRRTLRVPAGTWVDLWRSGGLEPSRARLLRGPRTVTVPAPVGRPPLLVGGGALVALLPAGVASLSRHAGRPGGTVGLAERARRRVLLAWPRGRSEAALGPEGRASSREDGRGWTLTVRSATVRRVAVRAALGALRRPFRPCAVRGAVAVRRVAGAVRATLLLRDGRATLSVLRSCGDGAG
jgi:alpha-glucosidase (family GH31 glycosyl hydrolase)